MPKKGNLATHNTSYMSPRLPPIRPKLFKEKRLDLVRILTQLTKDYRYKKDEIFKRMKVSTFVQLVVQVWSVQQQDEEYTSRSSMNNGSTITRPDTADLEVQRIQGGQNRISPAPSLVLTEGDYGAPDMSGKRSTLQGVIRGVGEMELDKPVPTASELNAAIAGDCPYLLLDVRLKDDYDMCHMLSAKNFPPAMLARSVNYETADMLKFKNVPGKIIVVYDEDEKLAPRAAETLVQRGYDNLFMLSGGMKVAYKGFPEGLFTGTPSQAVFDTAKRPKDAPNATQEKFEQHDIDKLHIYLSNDLADKSSGSRLSNASTAASNSRMGGTKSNGSKSYMSGSVTAPRPAFR